MEWGPSEQIPFSCQLRPPGQQGVWVPGEDRHWVFQFGMFCLLNTLATWFPEGNPSPKDDKVAFDLFLPIPSSFFTYSLLPHWGQNPKPFP